MVVWPAVFPNWRCCFGLSVLAAPCREAVLALLVRATWQEDHEQLVGAQGHLLNFPRV